MPETGGKCPQCGEEKEQAESGSWVCFGCFAAFLGEDFGEEEELDKKEERYEMANVLGQGAAGTVYRAHDRVMSRTVAIKRLNTLNTDEQARARFQLELETIAALDHPHIIPVFDYGELEGRAFYAMKYVAGGTLQGHFGSFDNTATMVTVLRQVAQAVDYGHRHGVLHRDLKPGNLLVDDGPHLYVSDFGLAKKLTGQAESSQVSLTGQVLGTPAYMSPEQARGDSAAITTASDVFALGVIFYEMLTGQRPFQGGEPHLIMRAVVQNEVTFAKEQRRDLGRDLPTICLKCLEKDPAKRYETAGELDADLARYERGEAIKARPVSAWERFGKLVRRNVAASLALGIATLLLIGLVGSIWISRENLLEEREETRRQVYYANVGLMNSEAQSGMMGLLPQYLEVTESYQDRGFEWDYWKNRVLAPERVYALPGEEMMEVAFEEKGRSVAAGGRKGTVQLYDEKGELAWQTKPVKEVFGLVFFADDQAVAVWGPDEQLVVLARADGSVIWEKKGLVAAARRAGTGELYLLGRQGRVWRTAGKEESDLIEMSSIESPATGRKVMDVAADGRLLVAPGKLWDPVRGELLKSFPEVKLKGFFDELRFVEDDQAFLRQSHRFDIKTGQRTVRHLHTAWNSRALVAPDNTFLVSDAQRGVVVYPPQEGEHPFFLRLGETGARAMALSSDGGLLATAHTDEKGGYIGLWQTSAWAVKEVKDEAGRYLRTVEFSPDGEFLLAGAEDGAAVIWESDTGERVGGFAAHERSLCNAFFLQDGKSVLTGGNDKLVKVTDWRTGEEQAVLGGHGAKIYTVAASPDGRWIMSGAADGTAKIWDLRTGKVTAALKGHRLEVCGSAFSPDGTLVATGGDDPEVRVWEVETGQLISRFEKHTGWVSDVVFDASGEHVVTCSGDFTVRMWRARTGEEVQVFTGHSNTVNSARFSPDGRRLFTAGDDGTVRVWDVESGRQLLALSRPGERMSYVAVSPCGQRVAASGQGQLIVWESAPFPAWSRGKQPREKRARQAGWLLSGDTASWMKCFDRSELSDLTLRDICLPATHDSTAYKVHRWQDRIKAPWLITQDLDLLGQLRAGARKFDLRVMRTPSGEFFMHHGKYPTISLDEALKQMAEFFASEAGKSETLVAEFSHFRNFQEGDLERLQATVHRHLQKWLYKKVGGPLHAVPLGELRGKILCVFEEMPEKRLPGLYALNRRGEAGLRIFDRYANADEVSILEKDQWLKFEIFTDPQRLFLLSWTLTPQTGGVTVPKPVRILGDQANQALTASLQRYSARNAAGRLVNFLNVDFYGSIHKEVLQGCELVMSQANWAERIER